MKQKLTQLINHSGAISEFDKYFWLSKLDYLSEEAHTHMYATILDADKELLHTQLQGISKIDNVIKDSYPELAETFLPDYNEVFVRFKEIEEEISEAHIAEIKLTLHQKITNEAPEQKDTNHYFDFIKAAEQKALAQMNTLSIVSSMPTMGQVKEKIRAIQEEVRELDLVVESRVFAALIDITKLKLPQLNDRILLALKFMDEAIEDANEDSYEFTRKAIQLIFEWDPTLTKTIESLLPDLKQYAQISADQNLVDEYSKKLIDKYSFGNASFGEQLSESIESVESDFHLLIPFVDKIGPLISIFDSIHFAPQDDKAKKTAKIDATLGILMLVLNFMNIDTIYILDFIPNIIRAIARQQGRAEEDLLSIELSDLIESCTDHPLTKMLGRLSYNIIRKKQVRLEKSIMGKRLWIELVQHNFWENIYFQQQYGNLELISKFK